MQDHIFVLLMQTGTSVAKVLQFFTRKPYIFHCLPDSIRKLSARVRWDVFWSSPAKSMQFL